MKKIFVLPVLVFLCACAEQEEYVERPVNDLYNDAVDALEAKKYGKAAKAFAEVERQHPYSNWALKAQILSAYCHYEAKKYDDAIDGFTIFTQLHPGHPDVAYAYYMMAMCSYEQVPIVEREQESTERALTFFEDLISRFPTSSYAADARFKISFLKEHLAAKLMYLGRFYQKQSNPIAALTYFQTVVKKYETSTHIEEALYRTVECSLMLNLREEAKKSTAVLGHNYPKGQWYQRAYDLFRQCGMSCKSVL